jgi:hypothetical protein
MNYEMAYAYIAFAQSVSGFGQPTPERKYCRQKATVNQIRELPYTKN